ncbi:MAG: hypothetical protein N3A53_08780, partial [Verrucomicrobiae bacterium]|nr:hypothetical protein [Verrucomicrobiae bacterium]
DVYKRQVLGSRVSMVSVQLADQPAQNQGEVVVVFFPNGTAEYVAVILRGQERGRALAVVVDPVTGRGQAHPVRL